MYANYTCTCADKSVFNVCQRILCSDVGGQCAAPGDVPDADLSVTSLTVGASATYTCRNGLRFESGLQHMTMMCMSNGQWSSSPGTCAGETRIKLMTHRNQVASFQVT